MTWHVTVGRPGITTAMMWHQLNSALYGGGRLRRPKASTEPPRGTAAGLRCSACASPVEAPVRGTSSYRKLLACARAGVCPAHLTPGVHIVGGVRMRWCSNHHVLHPETEFASSAGKQIGRPCTMMRRRDTSREDTQSAAPPRGMNVAIPQSTAEGETMSVCPCGGHHDFQAVKENDFWCVAVPHPPRPLALAVALALAC